MVREAVKLLQLRYVIEKAIADRLGGQRGQPLIALDEPAPGRDSIGLVVDALGIELVQIRKHRLLHELGVKGRNAIHTVRADEGEIAHPDAALAILVDQRDALDL